MNSVANETQVIELLATKKQRFVNYVLDITIFLLLGLAYRYVKYVVTYNEFVGFQEDMFKVRLFISVPIAVVYYATFETLIGRTPAKFITQTKVVSIEGGKPTFHKILLRSCCRFIPLNVFSFLFAKLGWHDKISKTRVVMIKK
jgi:uncharacterized RDD family membrane protein YckC